MWIGYLKGIRSWCDSPKIKGTMLIALGNRGRIGWEFDAHIFFEQNWLSKCNSEQIALRIPVRSNKVRWSFAEIRPEYGLFSATDRNVKSEIGAVPSPNGAKTYEDDKIRSFSFNMTRGQFCPCFWKQMCTCDFNLLHCNSHIFWRLNNLENVWRFILSHQLFIIWNIAYLTGSFHSLGGKQKRVMSD